MSEGHEIAEYLRCRDCGVSVIASFGYQTRCRCLDCWRKASPSTALEVLNQGARMPINVATRNFSQVQSGDVDARKRGKKARIAARVRLSLLFPDVYDMLHDEERVRRGLTPIARYDPLDFHEVASETLGWTDVYDALRSQGVDECANAIAGNRPTVQKPASPPKP